MFRVLVEVFSLNGLAAACSLLSKVRVPLVVVARVGGCLARIAGGANGSGSRPRLALLILLPMRPERPSAWNLAQGSLRSSGNHLTVRDSSVAWLGEGTRNFWFRS